MSDIKKKCFKCSIEWPLIYFYKHSGMKDGHLNKCKKCTRKDVRENLIKRADYYREYEKLRGCTPERLAFNYQNTKRWREKNPEKRKAHGAVARALKSGKLKKMPCVVCSEIKAHAHHEDYSRPLNVIWVCARHHREREIDLR